MKKKYVLTCLLLVVSITQADPQIEFELAGLHVRDFALSADSQELYLTMESISKDASQIIRLQRHGDEWSKPKMASFSGQFKDLEPFLHPNGLQLFFASNRDSEQKIATSQFDIWLVERPAVDKSWGDPIQLNENINTTEGDEFYPSIADNGNLYFTATKATGLGKEDIYVSRLIEGKYTEAEMLPASINSATYEFNAYISPDESMLLFSSYGRADDTGGGDLYVSYRVNNEWQAAENLGVTVNSTQLDYCPFYDFNNKTLYWTSNRTQLKQLPVMKRDYNSWYDLFTQGENGMSKIYQLSLALNPK